MHKIILKDRTFRQISYYKTGQGPFLMLVHGFPANAQLWRHIWPLLSEHYTLLLPDFFSSNGDWMQGGETDMSTLADGLKDILDEEQATNVVYCGHSMGGYMGLAFAGKYPEYLKGLSLVHSSPVADDDARREGRQKTIKILEQGGKSPFLKKMVRALFPPDFNRQHPDVVNRQTEEALQVPEESLIAFYRAIMTRQETKDIARNAVFPVQYVVGEKDTLANIHKDLSTDTLSSINFVRVYSDCAHMAMLERPELLGADLIDFAAYCYRNT